MPLLRDGTRVANIGSRRFPEAPGLIQAGRAFGGVPLPKMLKRLREFDLSALRNPEIALVFPNDVPAAVAGLMLFEWLRGSSLPAAVNIAQEPFGGYVTELWQTAESAEGRRKDRPGRAVSDDRLNVLFRRGTPSGWWEEIRPVVEVGTDFRAMTTCDVDLSDGSGRSDETGWAFGLIDAIGVIDWTNPALRLNVVFGPNVTGFEAVHLLAELYGRCENAFPTHVGQIGADDKYVPARHRVVELFLQRRCNVETVVVPRLGGDPQPGAGDS